MKTNNLQNQINKVISLKSLMLKSFAFVMLFTITFSTITPAFAAVPQSMSYTAVLRDATGTSLSGTYDFKVRYYDASTAGILMYEEEFTTTTINTGGTFFLPLGTGSIITGTFSSINFNSPIFITLNTKPTANVSYDGEMNPRIPLRSVPFALNSQKLDGRVVGGANGIVAYDASTTINTNGLNASGSVNVLGNTNLVGTTTASSIISTLINSVTGIINKLFLGVLNIGTPADTILVRDAISGEVKGISAASLFASNTPTSTLNLQQVTNNGATTTNSITVQDLFGRRTVQGNGTFTFGDVGNNNSTILTWLAPAGTNNIVSLPGTISGTLALSVNGIGANNNGDIDITPLLTNVGNFATADLVATGNRLHDFAGYSLDVRNVSDMNLISNFSGSIGSNSGFGSGAGYSFSGTNNSIKSTNLNTGFFTELNTNTDGLEFSALDQNNGQGGIFYSNRNNFGFRNNLSLISAFNVKTDGEVTFGSYSNSRNDATSTVPLNFLYTNPAGELLSAPISSLLSTSSNTTPSPITIRNGNSLFATGLPNSAGVGAANAGESVFLGSNSGLNATNAFGSNFMGTDSGNGATNAIVSNFFGQAAGQNADSASNSNFFGQNAGQNAQNASDSNFFGTDVGVGATFASNSNFFGRSAGNEATNAGDSNFFGRNAGKSATNAFNSNFFGGGAGLSAKFANNSIFIGTNSGNNDIVNNSILGYSSILIGDNTNTGGFSNSIALGKNAVNTKTNQFLVGPSYTDFNFRGVNYTFPSAQATIGQVLTNDGLGNLSWVNGSNANFATADLTANGNRIHDFAGFDLGINAINAFNITATSSAQAYTNDYNIDAENIRFLGANSTSIFSSGGMTIGSSGGMNISSTGGSTNFTTTGQNIFTATGNNIFTGGTYAVSSPYFGYSTLIISKGTQKQNFLELAQDSTPNSFGVMGGNINPEGAYPAALGSIYFNRNGTTGRAYLKTSNDVLSTGWDRILTLADLASTTPASTTNALTFSTTTNILSSNVNGILATTSISNIVSPITVRNGNSLFSTGLTNTGGGSVANNSNFFGELAGQGAVNANNSNFFGNVAGESAVNAFNSNFFGRNAGVNAASANNSNFMGQSAGASAINSFNSNFFGQLSGDGATNANNSNFFGLAAGRSATNARNSNFFGLSAGQNSANANNSIFIGNSSGANDTVNNSLNGTSILIGDNTNTGGFSNSIALGAGAINTATNQFLVNASTTNFSFRGVNYVFPNTQGATGTVLTNDGLGGLTWVPASAASTSSNAWSLTGNAGTDGGINNFIGTTDVQNLSFRTNNVEQLNLTQAGRLNFTNLNGDLFLNGGNETTTGGNNIGIGSGSQSSVTTGFNNISFGQNSLLFNTAGSGNMAIGQASLLLNQGNLNTAIGQGAGVTSNGNNNTFIGYAAGSGLSSGNNNIAIGQQTSFANITGSNQLTIGNWIYGDNGQIGIGNSAPAQALDVSGSIQFTRALMPAGNAGNIGEVLLSQGGGIAPIWVATSSLGLSTSPITIENIESLFSTGLSGAGVNATNANNSNFFGRDAGSSATDAEGSNFLGVRSGFSASNAFRSNFLGSAAGRQATNANNSNFLGSSAGFFATNANNSNFLGNSAGANATDASNSNFFGENSGSIAVNAFNSNFFGRDAGNGAIDANNSNFFGSNAGLSAVSARDSNFLGVSAGISATNAFRSNFIGYLAGSSATNANNSTFIGEGAGENAINASKSIFIGNGAGVNDSVNNVSGGSSIAIGDFSGTGGFSNSIALGANAVNTATNQFLVGSNYTDFSFRGVNYIMPSAQAISAGQVLSNDGAGNLSWATIPGSITDTNFATTDLTATGNRTHNFANNSLTFNNLSVFQLASSGGHNLSAGGLVDYVAAGGFRFRSPLTRIETFTPNTSGLRLVNLTSSSPVSTSTTQALGVDALGNVVTIAGAGSTTPTNGLQTISSSVGLGGALTQNTVIDGTTANNYSLRLTNGNLNLDQTNTAGTTGLVNIGGQRFINTKDGDTFVGFGAGNLNSNTTIIARTNAGFGGGAMQSIAVGARNTATGFNSLRDLTNGFSNSGFGFSAGANITTGSNNLALGNDTNLASSTASNQMNIANAIFGTGLSGSVLAPAGLIGIGTISPGNKLEIKSNATGTSGLRFTNLLSTSATTTSNGKALTVDTNGDVVLVDATSGASGWLTTGNAGTNLSTNFIGTTDAQDLVFRTNNLPRMTVTQTGRLAFSNTSGATNSNLFVGPSTGNDTLTGDKNVGFGKSALTNLISGSDNSAFGDLALASNAIGVNNAAFGSGTLRNNNAGNGNAVFGRNGLANNTGGNLNTAIGFQTMLNNTSGSNNTSIGAATLQNFVGTGISNNTALGSFSGTGLTTGVNNTFLGANISVPAATTGNIILADGLGNQRINVIADGKVGIGTNTPNNKLEITQGTAGNSGLRFTNLLSTSATTTSNGKALTVDTNGDVVLVDATSGASGWLTTGNAGTNPNTNFIGTTDANSLVFKVNNTLAGSIQNVSKNIFFGESAGNAIASATPLALNIGIGYQAMGTTSSMFSNNNIAIGYQSLFNGTNASQNTAIGYQSLLKDVSGSNNVANGSFALTSNVTGSNNVAVGFNSMFNNIAGSANTSVGYQSMFNSTGNQNTAMGFLAMTANTTGNSNSAFGRQALGGNTIGAENTAIGYQAGLTQTAGDNNIFIGRVTSVASTTGSNQLSLGSTIFGTELGLATSKIGIGTNSPTTKLEVVGEIKATGVLGGFTSLDRTNNASRVISYLIGDVFKVDDFGVKTLTSLNRINGNMGIGNISPNNRLEITSSFASSSGLRFTNLLSTSATTTTNGKALTVDANGDVVLVGLSSSSMTASNGLTLTSGNLALGGSLTQNTIIDGALTNSLSFTNMNLNLDNTNAAGTRGIIKFGTTRFISNAGNSNAFVGSNSGNTTVTGDSNNGFGVNALNALTTGIYNLALGSQSLSLNTTGINNTAVGSGALSQSTTGSSNIALGYATGLNLDTGSNNILIGNEANAPLSNTNNFMSLGNAIFATGISTSTILSTSTKIGIGTLTPSEKLTINTTNPFAISDLGFAFAQGGTGAAPAFSFFGDRDTGIYSPSANSLRFTAGGNSIFRMDATGIIINDIASAPTAMMQIAGGAATSTFRMSNALSGNTATDGFLTNFNGTNVDFRNLEGGQFNFTGNMVVFGTGSTCSIGTGTGATLCSSDERLKYDIATSTSNLEKILSLRSVNYKWNTNLNRSSSTQLGLIAQEVERVFPGYVSEVYDGMKGVDYAALVTPLIGSVQELNVKLTALETRTNASSTNSGVGSYADMIATLTNKFQDGTLDIIVNNIKAKKVETETLCIGTTCVSESQLLQLLSNANINPTPTPTPTPNNSNGTSTQPLSCTLPQVLNTESTVCIDPVIIIPPADVPVPQVDPVADTNASSTTP